MAGEAATGGPATTIGPTIIASSSALDDDDIADEEPDVIMGHPGLGAPGQVFVLEAVDMTLFALHQVQDVFQWERGGLDE
jgi:hypothetical protein